MHKLSYCMRVKADWEEPSSRESDPRREERGDSRCLLDHEPSALYDGLLEPSPLL